MKSNWFDGNHFVHAVRGIHAQEDSLGNWQYMAQDGLGSVRSLVDDAAVVQSSMSYDPYGNPMGSYGAGFGFTGEQTDSNDLLYLRARYYEPNLGVFSALDPFEGMQNRPMSLNGYSWVEGNVPNNVDPSGMQCELTDTLNNGTCLDTDQNDTANILPPYVPPPIDGNSAQNLVEVVGDYNKICRQWCNEDSDDYIVNKLSGYDCRRNAQDICNQLCLWSPRSDQNTVDHIGLIIRWLDYFVDKNNSRPTHFQPYQEVQGDLRQILENEGIRVLKDGDNIDGWGRSNCEEQNKAAKEFAVAARKWSEKSLPFSVMPSPIPECETTTVQYIAVGALAIITIGALVLIPTVGEEAIPIAAMGVVAPCLITG